MTFKEKYIKFLLSTGSILIKSIEEEPFTLRSGRKSYVFINHSIIASSPDGYKAFIDAVNELLNLTYGKKDFILCNVDSKISAQMVGSLAYKLNRPQIIFKSKELTKVEKGPGEQLTGNKDWNLPVAITDDVATGGDGTAANVGKLIRETFPKIKDINIFVGFIRNQVKSTFPTHSVLTFNELVKLSWRNLSKDQQRALKKEPTLNS